MTDQKIDIHVQSGTGEILRIVATILMFGGAGAIAWSVAQGEYADLAATGGGFHLQVKPGTDAFCLSAMVAVIVQEGLVHAEWVRDLRGRAYIEMREPPL